jgi:outer membrane protein TolC
MASVTGLLSGGCQQLQNQDDAYREFARAQFSETEGNESQGNFDASSIFPFITRGEEPAQTAVVVDPLDVHSELNLEDYLERVLQRHPTVDAAEAVLLGTRELYPQATAFLDPQVRFLNGPTLFGGGDGPHLWRMQAQQPFSAWGKRPARGLIAQAKAAAAQEDLRLTRIELRKTAAQAYFEYALVESLHPLFEQEHQLAVEELDRKQIQLTSSGESHVGQEELVQLEYQDLERQRRQHERDRRNAMRRVNLLLDRELDAPLPLLALPEFEDHGIWSDEALFASLAARHPALMRAEANCQEAEAKIKLAQAHYYPDFVLVSRFDTYADSFWMPDRAAIRPQLGINAILPVQRDSIAAAVRQAEAELRQRRAEKDLVERKLRRDVAETLESLDQLQENHSHLAAMASLARRRAIAFVSTGDPGAVSTSEVRRAQHESLKYEMDRLKADYALRAMQFELRSELNPEQVVVESESFNDFSATGYNSILKMFERDPISNLPIPEE